MSPPAFDVGARVHGGAKAHARTANREYGYGATCFKKYKLPRHQPKDVCVCAFAKAGEELLHVAGEKFPEGMLGE